MAIDYTNVQAIGTEIFKWLVRAIVFASFLIGIYLMAFFWNKKKRYKYTVRIFNKDATGNVVQQPDDRGGIFFDKKTRWRLFLLKKNKFGLDPDEIPYLLTSRGTKIVYLLQTGLKNFQFLRPELSENPGLKFNVQDEDIAWAESALSRYVNPYRNQMWQQIMPFIGMAFVFLIVVVALYYMVVKAGFNADLIQDLASTSREVSANLAKASLGTAVVD